MNVRKLREDAEQLWALSCKLDADAPQSGDGPMQMREMQRLAGGMADALEKELAVPPVECPANLSSDITREDLDA